MKDTSGLPSNMTKFSGLTEEELAKSAREDLDRIWASIKRLGIEVQVHPAGPVVERRPGYLTGYEDQP